MNIKCAWCGRKFAPFSCKQKFCESKCQRKHMHKLEDLTRGEQMRRLFVERVSFRAIYKRDGGHCRICGKPVKPKRHDTDIWAATLDHITPLALGGLHCKANVQLAHMICNSMKGQAGADYRIEDIDALARQYGWPPRE